MKRFIRISLILQYTSSKLAFLLQKLVSSQSHVEISNTHWSEQKGAILALVRYVQWILYKDTFKVRKVGMRNKSSCPSSPIFKVYDICISYASCKATRNRNIGLGVWITIKLEEILTLVVAVLSQAILLYECLPRVKMKIIVFLYQCVQIYFFQGSKWYPLFQASSFPLQRLMLLVPFTLWAMLHALLATGHTAFRWVLKTLVNKDKHENRRY